MSAYHTLRLRLTAASPLLMHNGRLADPLDDHARAIAQVAGKRRKTEADHRHLAELEFRGGLYTSGGVPCIPAEMVEAALVRAAAQERRSPRAKAGLVVRDDLRLEYEGPTDIDGLWRDPAFRLRSAVRVGPSRIMRTRPQFREWAADLVIDYLPGLLNSSEVHGFVVVAGEQVGLGDWRPRFGRFWVDAAPAQEAGPGG